MGITGIPFYPKDIASAVENVHKTGEVIETNKYDRYDLINFRTAMFRAIEKIDETLETEEYRD